MITPEEMAEWHYANEIIKKMPIDQKGLKISKKDHQGKLSCSFLCLPQSDGSYQLWRVSKEVYGKGTQGKGKILTNENGEKLFVKIQANASVNLSEEQIMTDLGLLLGSFIRQKEEKFSKTMEKMIGNKKYVVMPFEGVDLGEMLKSGSLNEDQCLHVAIKLSENMESIHGKKVLHRDIKPANVSVKMENGEIKSARAIDFGTAIKLDDNRVAYETLRGSPRYFPPEADREILLKLGAELTGIQQDLKTKTPILISEVSKLNKEEDQLKSKIKNLQSQINTINTAVFRIHELFSKEVVKHKIKDFLDYFAGANLPMKKMLNDLVKLDKKVDLERLERALKWYIKQDAGNAIRSLEETKTEVEKRLGTIKKKIAKQEKSLQQMKDNKESKLAEINKIFNQKHTLTPAFDVYSMGIMFKRDLKLNLKAMGLSNMLAEKPEDRPGIEEVRQKLNQFQENVIKIKDILRSDKSLRLPPAVTAGELHIIDNKKLSLLSKEEIQEVETIRAVPGVYKIGEHEIYVTDSKRGFVYHNDIAEGNYGSARLVQDVDSAEWKVAKYQTGLDNQQIRTFEAEKIVLNDLGLLDGKLEMQQGSNAIRISMQPYVYGETYYSVFNNQDLKLSVDKYMLMAREAILAMQNLHEKGFLHADPSLGNYIWDDVDQKCKLIDVGNCQKGSSVENQMLLGDKAFMAPELNPSAPVMRGRTYNQKTDIYGMGVILSALLSRVESKNAPKYEALKQLVDDLKATDPQKRPTLAQALEKINKMMYQPQILTQSEIKKGSKETPQSELSTLQRSSSKRSPGQS